MLAYNIGVFLGAVTQPSTIIIIILSLILHENKKSLLIFLLILMVIAQWILKASLGSPSLSLWPTIVTFLTGYFFIFIINSRKKKNKSNKEEVDEQALKETKKNILKLFSILIFFIFSIALILIFTPIKEIVQTHLIDREVHEGYTKVNETNRINLEFENQIIDTEVFQYIHYKNQNKFAKELDFFENPLNSIYLKCVEGDSYDIGCLTGDNQSFFNEDACLWTFNSYVPLASKQNYYLINVNERACGSYPGEFNSYYLVKYDGKSIDIIDSIPTGKKYAQRAIEFYKINNDGFSIITETCYKGADTCKGMKPDFLELKF